jgi:hypothetical protein
LRKQNILLLQGRFPPIPHNARDADNAQEGWQELNGSTDNKHMPMIVFNIPNFGRKSCQPPEGDD